MASAWESFREIDMRCITYTNIHVVEVSRLALPILPPDLRGIHRKNENQRVSFGYRIDKELYAPLLGKSGTAFH